MSNDNNMSNICLDLSTNTHIHTHFFMGFQHDLTTFNTFCSYQLKKKKYVSSSAKTIIKLHFYEKNNCSPFFRTANVEYEGHNLKNSFLLKND